MKTSLMMLLIAAAALLGALQPGAATAALYGNDTAATARPLAADGTAYVDAMTPTSTVSWFAFRIDPHQSYAIECWSPFGGISPSPNAVHFIGLYESDGTTLIPTTGRAVDLPAPQLVAPGVTQGCRQTFISAGSARHVLFRINKNGPAPSARNDFAVRIVTTTMAAARWSVNGYSDLFALSNVAVPFAATPVGGSILYFNEAGALVGSDGFSLGANASAQIIKPNGVPIGGATRGSVRIVHNGAPGAIVAQQTWFNPVTGQFVQYPFTPLLHSYGRGGF